MCHEQQATGRGTASCCAWWRRTAPWSALAAVGRGASGQKDMSLVRTPNMLYNAKVKRTDSDLGEVEEVVAGVSCQLGLATGGSIRGPAAEPGTALKSRAM